MALPNEAERISGEIFLDQDETLLCVAGKKQLNSFLNSGKPRKGFAVLSDRAIYCKGKFRVSRDHRHYRTESINYRIDLEEFDAVKYLQQRNPVWITLAFFFLLLGPVLLLLDNMLDFESTTALNLTLDAVLCILLAGVFSLIYLIHSKNLLELLHTNGSMGLDRNMIPEKEDRLLIRYLNAYLNNR